MIYSILYGTDIIKKHWEKKLGVSIDELNLKNYWDKPTIDTDYFSDKHYEKQKIN